MLGLVRVRVLLCDVNRKVVTRFERFYANILLISTSWCTSLLNLYRRICKYMFFNIDSFLAKIPILYPLKTPGNMFSGGNIMMKLAKNG